jgi:hypothetical protein
MFGNGYVQFVIGFASAVSVIAMTGNPYLKAVLQYAFQELIEKKRRSYITGTLDQIKPCHGVPSLVKSIDSAILILQIARSADQLIRNDPDIDEFFAQLNEVAINSNRIARQGFGNTKVLCIEGLSGSGKSTLVQGLTCFAGVTVVGPMATPNLERILDLFSGSPEPVLTALCFALNYCTAHRIISETAAVSGSGKALGQQQGERLVVVDQFYHSVCARTVCANVGCDVDLKSLPASAFEWPLDLPTPSLVRTFELCILCTER